MDDYHGLSQHEVELLRDLHTPFKIQEFLDGMVYSADPFYRCPRSVLRDRKAHCFDGALFAAAALRFQGFKPLIMELTAERDDDHLLALFQIEGHWGAVAKSNFAGIRFREAIYRNLRELAMSYFEPYYNTAGEKTLRGYSRSLDLEQVDHWQWLIRDDAVDWICQKLEASRHYSILTPGMLSRLSPVDKRLYDSGLLGSLQEGLYQP